MSTAEPLTITDAAPLIRSGVLTPSDLLEQCLARIDVYEPAVKAWVYLDRERARQDAARLTDELKRGQHRGPLHGIPVGIKDIIDVFDMPTGCGSKLWANSYARRDATCVERLRQAGAIVLGKTVTTPYAFTDPPVTRNPWNLDRTPGGSSSGSAAAVACGMCLAALGTQTGGSLTRPASYCGVCSLKPTYGRVSVDGVLPLAPSLDHVGVIAGCVRDLAHVLQVIARTDFVDSPYPYHYTSELVHERHTDRQLTRVPDFLPSRADPVLDAAYQRLIERTEPKEWAWSAVPLLPSFGQVLPNHATIAAVEAAAFHAERLARQPDEYPPRIRDLIERGLRTPATEYLAAIRHRKEYRDESPSTFLDSWQFASTLATTDFAPETSSTGDMAFQAPWSYAGTPTVSLPFEWFPTGLAACVQLIAREHFEDDLLRVAMKLEADLALPRTLPPPPPR